MGIEARLDCMVFEDPAIEPDVPRLRAELLAMAKAAVLAEQQRAADARREASEARQEAALAAKREQIRQREMAAKIRAVPSEGPAPEIVVRPRRRASGR